MGIKRLVPGRLRHNELLMTRSHQNSFRSLSPMQCQRRESAHRIVAQLFLFFFSLIYIYPYIYIEYIIIFNDFIVRMSVLITLACQVGLFFL